MFAAASCLLVCMLQDRSVNTAIRASAQYGAGLDAVMPGRRSVPHSRSEQLIKMHQQPVNYSLCRVTHLRV
jgi:hypothetical protein